MEIYKRFLRGTRFLHLDPKTALYSTNQLPPLLRVDMEASTNLDLLPDPEQHYRDSQATTATWVILKDGLRIPTYLYIDRLRLFDPHRINMGGKDRDLPMLLAKTTKAAKHWRLMHSLSPLAPLRADGPTLDHLGNLNNALAYKCDLCQRYRDNSLDPADLTVLTTAQEEEARE